MGTLGLFYLFVMFCSVLGFQQRVLDISLALMDSGDCGKAMSQLINVFLVFRWFSRVFNVVGLCLIFGLGLQKLQFTWHGKRLVQFLCDFNGKSGYPKAESCLKKGSLKLLEDSKSVNKDGSLIGKELVPVNPNRDTPDDDDDDDDDDDCQKQRCLEDEEFDVMALRRLVKIERMRANMAFAELEQERMATASAADEAMAMIMRLQNDKSSIQIEADQYRKLAEQMKNLNQDMIESLKLRHEWERTVLEDKLVFFMEKLKQYISSDEMDQFESFCDYITGDDGTEDLLNDLALA